jgi:hypothetical protein
MVPDSHAALAEQLRDRAEALDGHIATYDIRQSGSPTITPSSI